MWTTYKLLGLAVTIVTIAKVQLQECRSSCLNSNGHIENCVLNKPEHVIEEQVAVSQLQCFDHCLRHPRCTMYNYKKAEHSSCQLLGGLWSFDDEKALVKQNDTVFSWLDRDHYLTWTRPTCQGNTCPAASNDFFEKPLDIAFVVDTSVIPGALNQTKQFIVNVLQKFKLSSQHTKVAVVEYNTNARISFSFNNFTTSSSFFNFLSLIKDQLGQTRYDRALFKAESELFSSQGGARPFAHRVVVLIVDEDVRKGAQDIYPVPRLIESMKKKCIKVFAVGIGNGKYAASLVSSAERHLLQVELFNQLVGHSESFAKNISIALS